MNISDKYKLIFFHLPKCAGKSVVSSLGITTSDKTNIKIGLKHTTLLGFEQAYWNQKIYPEKWNTYKKFTIVRNPWDRMVSLYHYRKKENDLYTLFPPAFGMNIAGGNKVGPDGKEWDFKRWILSSFVKGLPIKRASFSNENPPIHAVKGYEVYGKDLKYDSKTLEEGIEHHRFFTEKDNYIKLCRYHEKLYPRYGLFVYVRDRIEWFNQIDIISGLDGEKLVDYILRFEHLEEMWNKMFKELGYELPKLPKKNTSKHKHYSEYYDDETREFVSRLFKKDIDTFGYKFKNGE